jgi:hypothetical protein
MTAPTLLIDGTDLTRYDREILLDSWGPLVSGIEHVGDDVDIPGMAGVIYGGRVAASRAATLTVELTGQDSAAHWPADPVAQFYTNLATLKALTAPGSSPNTLTVQPAGTTCLAVRSGLTVTMLNDHYATVELVWTLLEGTL